MDYEKKYKYAMEAMREWIAPCHTQEQLDNLKRTIFPELAVSEDEMIRKFLHHTFTAQYLAKDKLGKWHGEPVANILAWLENQGNPSDKDMKEALRTEYEKGKADAFAQMQKEWSEEDKDFMYDTLSNLTELKDRYGEGYGNVGRCIDWVKDLKDRVQPQTKQEWSEEDEKMLNHIIGLLEGLPILHNWLKSLKQRYTWKPSDEQMHYLNWIANIKLGDSVVEQEVSKRLNSLYNDLKKLKGH